MTVYCLQLNPSWEDKASNFESLRELLGQETIAPGSLILLPEMFATGFSMDFASLAEKTADSPTLNFLGEIARQYQCAILAGMVLDRDGQLTNDAVMVNAAGELQGHYSKIHPFTPSGENVAGTAGKLVATFSFHDWTLAPFVCYDLRFPEIFRQATPAAELLVVLANWPSPRIEHWVTLLRARAIENQAYVVGVNRVGSDPHLDFSGRSLIIDPKGEILADAGSEVNLICADLDLAVVRQWRGDFPATNDRTVPAQVSVTHYSD